MNIKKMRILRDVILFAALLLLCFAGCQNNDYADIYETPGAEGSVGQATNTDDYSGGLLGDKPNAGSTPPLAEPIATPIGGVLPDVKTQAEQIISRSRRYNTTDILVRNYDGSANMLPMTLILSNNVKANIDLWYQNKLQINGNFTGNINVGYGNISDNVEISSNTLGNAP